MECALGKMRMDPDVFWRMSPREFFPAWHGFLEEQARIRREAAVRTTCLIRTCSMSKIEEGTISDLYREMCGEEPVEADEAECRQKYAEILAESHERVRLKEQAAEYK